MRHGPHHGAHASSSTGSGECSTSAANVASVTTSGVVVALDAPAGSGVLHRPHTGCRPACSLSLGTRLVAPHVGHRTSAGSAIARLSSESADSPARTPRVLRYGCPG